MELRKEAILVTMRRFVLLFLLALPWSASAATLYLDPDSGEYGPGDTFIARVRLHTDECVNAASVEVKYPANLLKAVDFSRGSSILSLWVGEPKLDTEHGSVSFSGGIPGGYCGRVAGDPVISNILGKIVFTVQDAGSGEANIDFAPSSSVLLHDGQGTPAELSMQGAHLSLVSIAQYTSNPWVEEVAADDIPPDAFDVEVHSTRGVLGGNYYIVFSTVDKQSGLDHYEVYERERWKRIDSPYKLRDQSLQEAIQVRAIDKAGNERIGSYDPSKAPPRQSPPYEYWMLAGLIGILLLGIFLEIIHKRRIARVETPTEPPGAGGVA